jgi:hypothetical protein
MPTKLSSTVVSRISELPNPVSVQIVHEFYQYMKENGASEKHMTNELQVVLYFAGFLDIKTSLLDASRQNILEFLDNKRKDASQAPVRNNAFIIYIISANYIAFTTRVRFLRTKGYSFIRRFDSVYTSAFFIMIQESPINSPASLRGEFRKIRRHY